MGQLALAAKITHVPSMYLSELPGARQGTRQDAIDGHKEIGRRCRELGVDTLVVFDTHWLVNATYHLNCAPRWQGTYTSNELPHFISNMAYGFNGNPELGRLLAKVCNEQGVETLAHDATSLQPEYGTLVPMRYMNADEHFKVMSVSALCTSTTSTIARAWAGPCAGGREALRRQGGLPRQRLAVAPLRAKRPGARIRLQDLEPVPGAPGPRGDPDVAKRRVERLLRHAARVRHQGPRRGHDARHRHAAGRAGLVGL
jgi:hypothetical protein